MELVKPVRKGYRNIAKRYALGEPYLGVSIFEVLQVSVMLSSKYSARYFTAVDRFLNTVNNDRGDSRVGCLYVGKTND